MFMGILFRSLLTSCAFFAGLLLTTAAVSAQTKPIVVESVLITAAEQVEVASGEAGLVSAMVAQEGQSLSEGALLVQIADDEPQLAKRKAELEFGIAKRQYENDIKVRFAKKSVEVAKAELRRANESIEKFRRSVSQTEIDQLQLAAERAVLEVEQAEHDRELAELTARLKENEVAATNQMIARRRITAPISGIVVQLKRRKGEWVQPGEVVVRMVRLDRLRAEGFLNAKDVVGDLAGASVRFTTDLPGMPKAGFSGKVVFVSPEINPLNNQVRFWAEIDNPDRLLRTGAQGSLVIGGRP